MTDDITNTEQSHVAADCPNERLVMLRRYGKDELPPPSEENKLQSIKVLNQEGDSVYYSYGYKRWGWWLSVNFEEERRVPIIDWWQLIPQAT